MSSEGRRGYSTDVTDAQWQAVEPLLRPRTGRRGAGRPPVVDLLRVLDARFYQNRTGCQWRLLPHDFPAWGAVRYYFDKWQQDGTWERVNDGLRRAVRWEAGREPEPTAGVIDSQSVKSTEVGGDHGYDGRKKVNGRKRHIVVDTEGNLLRVWVSTAKLSDREAVWWWLEVVCAAIPTMRKLFADQGYTGAIEQWAQEQCGIVLDIIKKKKGQAGFVLLPRRWVVERTFAWLGRNRRLAKDYEQVTECSETWIYLASIRLLLTRLTAAYQIS